MARRRCQSLTFFAMGVRLREEVKLAMNVSLTPELESFVQNKVSSGRYTSASEVVREALRLLEEQEKARASQLAAFRSEVDRRLGSLDRGEGLEGEAVFERIREKSKARRRAK